MLSEQRSMSVKPTYYFNTYLDMLSFIGIEEENVDNVIVYFIKRDKSLEEYIIGNLRDKYNFPFFCKIILKNSESKLFTFDYSKIEDI